MKKQVSVFRKFLCHILVFAMIISMMPVSASAAAKYSFDGSKISDYRAWSQDQMPWGIERLGEDNMYGGFNYAGCLLTSYAKLSVQLGARNVSNVNPGIVNTTFTNAGIMDTNGNLEDWKKAASLLGMTYEGTIKYSEIISKLKATDKNYGIILKTGGVKHFVPIDKTTTISKNEIYIHDSWSNDPSISNSKLKSWLYTEKASTAAKYTTRYNQEKSYVSNLVSKKYTKKYTISGTKVYLFSVPNLYKVTLNANGGIVKTSSLTVKKNQNYYSSLPAATRTGYTFKGWYTAKSGGTKISSKNAVLSKDTTIYAQWKKNPSYTVYLKANGGKVSKSSIKVTKGLTYSGLPTPTRSNYTFQGWYTKKSGGTKVTTSTTVKLTKNQTLYAQWKWNGIIPTYTIKLDANGGKCKVTSLKYKSTEKISAVPVPSKNGYDFKGWYTQKSGGTLVTTGTKVSSLKNCTLYAQWKTCSHKYTSGICSKCKYEWPWWNNVSAKKAFTCQVSASGGAPVWNRPYSGNANKITTMKYGSYVSVVGQITNTDKKVWYKLSNGNWIYSGNVRSKSVSNVYYVKGTDESLNINKTASSKKFTGVSIPEGAACVVTPSKRSGKWWYVNYNGTKGYVYSTYLTKTAPSVSYAVTKSALTIRATQSAKGTSRGTVPEGAKVIVYSNKNGWKLIQYNGVSGYVTGL